MKKLFLLLIIPMSFTFCKKATVTPTVTKTDLITNASYKTVSETINGQLVQIKPCNVDDRITFAKDGTWEINIGSTKCSNTDMNSSGKWLFLNNEATLQLGFGGSFYIYKIKTLNANTLILIDESDPKNIVETTYSI